jgi:Mg2+-importing ATPase
MTMLDTAIATVRRRNGITPAHISRATRALLDAAIAQPEVVLESLGASPSGLSLDEANERLERYGYNEAVQEQKQSWFSRLWDNVRNPLVVLLLVLAAVSFVTGDLRGGTVMCAIVVIGVALRYFQEARADKAAAELKAMVTTTATVLREGARREIPIREIVPGDIVLLSAGDMVPADVRILSAKDLFANQASLTGEAMPVEKVPAPQPTGLASPLEATNIAFMGTNIESGSATAVVVLTGADTYFGSLAKRVTAVQVVTSFDRGINSFTWLMIRFMFVMVPAVFIINGLSKHNWLEAFMFALAVAVGLTPEMLPMIVSVNLSKGAISMSKKKVIVKRLNAIQNFGAMETLCTDKTGTLTEGRVVLERHLDVHGDESEDVLDYAYLNSYYQTGLKNMLDVAVLEHEEVGQDLNVTSEYSKVDEIPFDFVRRRMSVVVEDKLDRRVLICKGAVEEVLSLCNQLEGDDGPEPMEDAERQEALKLARDLNEDGFRVLALAYRYVGKDKTTYSVADESDMVLLGLLAFLDPPKETAAAALEELHGLGVRVKILTGDNEVVTRRICKQVGLKADDMLLGGEIENMPDDELARRAETATVFAKLSPAHKERIIRALQRGKHVVGFLGDGINDAPALRAADVGISVDSAVDIAKESSDIILLENSLLVLADGVIEGRKVFGNIVKYIKMAASSNFGNMFSVVGASIFLPFLPMLPLQVLTNNLLYDFSQTAIPTDTVDEDWLRKPRKWAVGEIRRFIMYIGPISSIFDYATYFIMLYVFNCWNNPALFHTGWFVESIFTQTLIIHVIRTNKIAFVQSRASWPLTLTSLLIVSLAAWLTVSPLAPALGFVPLPALYWPLLALMLLCYMVLTHIVKTWFIRRFAAD